ncbi:MAG: hypothetical protein U9Q67_04925 [Patescibacteria group bacterium]|nr:hypothetical protein [Patescibacteria group bacterium]
MDWWDVLNSLTGSRNFPRADARGKKGERKMKKFNPGESNAVGWIVAMIALLALTFGCSALLIYATTPPGPLSLVIIVFVI